MLRLILISSLAVLILNSQTSEGCSCFPTHPQSVYCNADFVILATATKRIPGEDEFSDVQYILRNFTFLKASDKAKKVLRKSGAFTGANSAICGVELELNKQYILTGGINEDKARIGLCGYSGLWSQTPAYQRRGFRSIYKTGCDCQIEFCFEGSTDCGQPSEDKCVLSNFCYSEFSSCLKDDCGQCEWQINNKVEECIENSNQPE